MVALIDQPTTRRENRSSTAATYSHPSAVQMYVKSAIHLRLGAGASKLRSSTFAATAASGRSPDRPADDAVAGGLARPAPASAARCDAGRMRCPRPARRATPAARRRSGRWQRSSPAPSRPRTSSLRDRALGDRPSQAWKPERDTPSAAHSHATGQIPRCFAMKPNFMSTPSRRRLWPFLGCRAPPSAG